MKSFARLISKLPFAGKVTIRQMIFELYQSITKKERWMSYLQLLVTLILLILFHAVQAYMGIEVLGFNAPLLVKTAGALYALANTSVVLTQIYLVFRITRFYFCFPLPRLRREYTGYSGVETVTVATVTLGGQIIFFFLYIWCR